MKRISKIVLKKMVDTDAELSDLGEYSSKPGPNAIDREERGDMGHGEYRYFNPAMSGEESGNPESPEQDYQRCEDYNRGEWSYLGIRAECEIQTSESGNVWLSNTVTSGGLWHVESDSDESYFSEVGSEQLAELKTVLSELGFTAKEINKAFADVKQGKGKREGAEDYKFIDG